MIYTGDPVTPDPRYGGLADAVLDCCRIPSPDGAVVEIQSESAASDYCFSLRDDTSGIAGLDLFPACWAIFYPRERLMAGGSAGGAIVVIDSNAFLCAITRAAPHVPIAGDVISSRWWPIAFPELRIWPGRVDSVANPADPPRMFRLLDSPPGPFARDESSPFARDESWYTLVSALRPQSSF